MGMLLLTSLMSLLVVGMAVDVSVANATTDEDSNDSPDMPDITPDEVITDGGDNFFDEEDETQTGTPGIDALMGYGGNDLLNGLDGDDDLRGGLGDDTLLGGAGNDSLQGEGEYGIGGDDLLNGGNGDDLLAGQAGNDTVLGGNGDDAILGGEGNDSLAGGAGNDWISGNDGDDTLIAGDGSDDLSGDRGNDMLIGHDSAATVWLHGGEGDDTLLPGIGDFAEGQEGADLYSLKSDLKLLDTAPLPIIMGFDGDEDVIEITLPGGIVTKPQITITDDADGSAILRVDGEAVGRLIGHTHLRAEDIIITRQ